ETVPMFGRTRVYSQPPRRRSGWWKENHAVSVAHQSSPSWAKWTSSSRAVSWRWASGWGARAPGGRAPGASRATGARDAVLSGSIGSSRGRLLTDEPRDLLAQQVLLDLAARRHRKALADLETLRQLPRGDLPVAEEGHHLVEGERVSRSAHDEGAHALGEHGIRHRHARGLRDLRMREEQLLDLPGADVGAAPDDHVRLPADDGEVTLGIQRAEVARLVPAIGAQDGRGPHRIAIVAREQRGRPDLEFARLAGRLCGPGVGIDDARLDAGQDVPVGAVAALRRHAGRGGADHEGLGRPVARRDVEPVDVLGAAH